MKTKLLAFALTLMIFAAPFSRADEGMWIPLLIEKYNIKLMQEKGFKLSAEDIYSVNKACMKDAVLSFGGGCTGEVISPDGLLITNHHCGYGQIQKHSSLEHDYLTDGFWAMSREEELSNPGLTVTFLKRMEDVTEKVMEGVTKEMTAEERDSKMNANMAAIRKNAAEGNSYSASVRPFYMGNQYFLFVNEVFRDVRLVGAPPSSIGKFGGDTDNWIWPRHTGDFSLFRIYAGKDNKPADYSKDNLPYKPLYHFPISLKGVKEGDFTMVFGYPGSTSEYVPSYHVDMVKNYLNPKMIEIRTKKIDIIDAAMNSDKLIRIQYSAKKAGLSNSWKKWIGENQGLERMKTIDKKREFESKLTEWISADSERSAKYGKILPRYTELYSKLNELNPVSSYTSEVFSGGVEAIGFSRNTKTLADLYNATPDAEKIKTAKANLLASAEGFFRNYDAGTDKKLFIALMTMYGENLATEWQAPEYLKLKSSCKGDFSKIADKLYDKSVFTDQVRFKAFIGSFNKSSVSKLNKDLFYTLILDVNKFLDANVRPELSRVSAEIQKLNKDFMTLQMEYDKSRLFYPDANSTLMVAYGTVIGYES